MSVAEPHLPLQPLADWLPALAPAQVLDLTGRRAWESAREHPYEIEGRPRPVGGKLVRATVTREGAAPGSVHVGLGAEGSLACRCDCDEFAREPPCGHVVGLMLALAQDDDLREQLVAAPPSPRDEAREARRRAAALDVLRRRGVDLAEHRRGAAPPELLDLTFAGWRRRGPLRPIGPASWSLEVERDEDSPEEPPRLRVVILPEENRSKPFGPDDLESRRLPAREWRLVEPLARSPSGARDFTASGDAACSFLDRVAEAGISLAPAGPRSAIAITTAELRPSLELRAARAEEIGSHALLADESARRSERRREMHEAWVAYNAIVAPIDEGEFRRLLDLEAEEEDELVPGGIADVQVLEAVWVAADPHAAPSYLPLPAPLARSVLFRGPTTWVYLEHARSFARVARDVGPIAMTRLLQQPSILLSRGDAAKLPALLAEHFQSEGILLPRREALGLPPPPRARLRLKVSGSLFAVEAHLEASYGSGEIELGPQTTAGVADGRRDVESESAAIEALATTALHWARERGRRRRADSGEAPPRAAYRADGEHAVRFWTKDLPDIVSQAGRGGPIDDVIVPAGFQNVTVREPLRSRLDASARPSGLLQIALAFASEGVAADVDEIRAAIETKRRWVRLTDGSIASLSERVAELAAATQDTLGAKSSAEIERHALGEARVWTELADEVSIDATVRGWTERLRALDVAADPAPVRGLRAELRAYQKTGLAWLQFLAELGTGGILADDMGLGKTVQALALLAWRRERDGPAPSLVVAPTSVAPNWLREASRFVPELETMLLHGSERHARRADVPRHDLVVTTYALLRRDIERLRDVRFRYVILDEAQHIKNHQAATTAAARALDSEARLALTGTPLENRLLELWSILDFVNPGMLGSWRDFSRRWERPLRVALDGEPVDSASDASDDGAGDDARAADRDAPASHAATAALRARIRPFLLRRTKAAVERDLPPKIETDVVVELTPAQRRAYAALAAAAREDLAKKLSKDGFERSRMAILTALLRLRQMACDPRLIDSRHRPADSAKLGALRELVAEVIASGRRALVFSQFVQLLTLVRADLDEQKIDFAYLDGRTRDRTAVIDGFVHGTMPVFLLSLRAGGTGLNLSAADVVIHLDPWWNPAVEDQATDRAHRIGQRKAVSVYRIVAAGTIEEAILRMKERKRALASAVIGDGEQGLPRGLTEADVDELLRFGR
ncbi:MAG: DEAD/DEAH box helicase [Deltaproteobacteria bacterium]|nr:DEAD/DEAH box helicase [Deltaproteobacteria bacterium]